MTDIERLIAAADALADAVEAYQDARIDHLEFEDAADAALTAYRAAREAAGKPTEDRT